MSANNAPVIPAHLLTFDAVDWEHIQPDAKLELTNPGFRQQKLQEHWLQARDQWCQEQGIDATKFEMLAAWQRATANGNTSPDETE